MNDAARHALVGIVARHGPSVATDPRRCEALLRDYAGQHRREIFVLVSAAEEGVGRDLLDENGIPKGMLARRLAARLVDHRAISDDAARWAVASWAAALGVGPFDEVDEVGPPPPAALRVAVAPTAPASEPPRPSALQAPRDATRVVAADGSGDFTTIGEAIAAAAPGARVLVRPGVYEEGIVLDRAVEVAGDGPVERIVVRSARSSCVRMETDEAAVRGLTLKCRAGHEGEGFFGVDVPRGRLWLEGCDVSSDSLSCVAIHGAEARPVLLRCAIHGGADAGVYVFDRGAGTIEACDVFANANVGIAITTGGDPAVRDCRIFRGGNAGVVSWDRGAGTIERCEIFGNAQAGVGVSEGGDPTVTSCRIYDGGNSGVFVHDRGRGTFVGCDVSGHRETELAITSGGAPLVRGCAIHDGNVGVLVGDRGEGTFESCEVARNEGAGVALSAAAGPTFRGCRIGGNGGAGVRAEEGADATLVDCDLTGNALGAWSVDPDCDLRGSDNVE